MRPPRIRESRSPMPWPCWPYCRPRPRGASATAASAAGPAAAPGELTGRELLNETAKGLGRLMNYLRANLGSFLDRPAGSEAFSGMGLADVGSEFEETLRLARDLRDGLRSWAAG